MSKFSEKARAQPVAVPLKITIESVQTAYLALRRSQRWLVGMVVACAVLGTTVFRARSATLGTRSFMPVIICTAALTFAYTLRTSMVLPALQDLRRSPRDPLLLKRWSRNNFIVMALCAVVGLVGFGMQLFGAAMPVSITLYAIAVAYLILLRPARP